MRKLNDFISEKLNINSNDIVNHKKYGETTRLIRSIMEHIGLDEFDEWRHYIRDWVNDNNVSRVFYYGKHETLYSAIRQGIITIDLAHDFEYDSKFIDLCKDELSKCKKVIEFDDDKEYASIMTNNNMLAFTYNIGTLYCTKEKIQNINK